MTINLFRLTQLQQQVENVLGYYFRQDSAHTENNIHWLNSMTENVRDIAYLCEPSGQITRNVIDRIRVECNSLLNDIYANKGIRYSEPIAVERLRKYLISLVKEIETEDAAIEAQIKKQSVIPETEPPTEQKEPCSFYDQKDEISRKDLLAIYGIKSSALDYRMKQMGHPKPIRDEGGKNQWFSITAVDEWKRKRKLAKSK